MKFRVGTVFRMNIHGYLNQIRSLAQSGLATEHSYRPALESLFRSIDDDVTSLIHIFGSDFGSGECIVCRERAH